MSGSEFWQAEQRFDLLQYVKAQGAEPAVFGRQSEFILECPDCERPKLAINVQKRAWQCFHCGDGGRDAISFVVKAGQMFWKDAMAVILHGNHTAIGRIDQLEALVDVHAQRPHNWVPPEVPYPHSFEYVSMATRAGQYGVAYCQKRGILEHVWQDMKLGVCTEGRQKMRLVFPAFDLAGRLVFYQGRAMWEPSARPMDRYIKTLGRKRDVKPDGTSDDAGSGDCLLNLECVHRMQCQRVLVVEGPVDCAHAWPDAVAVFGKKISDRQIELLMRAGVKEIDLGLDPEATQEMMTAAPVLADLFTVRLVQFPAGYDPGMLTKEQIDGYRAQAVQWGTGERLARVNFELSGR